MAFISPETLKNMRRRKAVELDLTKYVGEEKKLLVRPIPFTDAVLLESAKSLPSGDQVAAVIKALASASLDPETLEPIGEADLKALFSELSADEGSELLASLQALGAKAKPAGN